MKKYIAIFAFILMSSAAFAQNGLNHVFVQRDIIGDQVTYNVILAGPGANDVKSMDITLSSGMDCRVCTSTTLLMSSSTGNQWTGGGQGFVALALGGPGRIKMETTTGDIDFYTFVFNPNGPGASSGHATVKAELE